MVRLRRTSPAALGDTADYRSFRLLLDGRRRSQCVAVQAALTSASGCGAWGCQPVSRRVRSSAYPVWSPDGKTIVFRANSTRNLYRKDSSGTGPEERLTQSPNQQTPTDWSRDGRWILYYEMAPDSGWTCGLFSLPPRVDSRLAPRQSPTSRPDSTRCEDASRRNAAPLGRLSVRRNRASRDIPPDVSGAARPYPDFDGWRRYPEWSRTGRISSTSRRTTS